MGSGQAHSFRERHRVQSAGGQRPDNQSKSDKTPSQWMPPNAAYHCFYAGKYLSVAAQYELPITEADRRALTSVAPGC